MICDDFFLKKLRGFTLIEILFLILIFSIVILHITQIKASKAKAILIEKAASEMDSLELPVLSYYTAYGQWPSSLNKLINSATDNNPIPKSMICSPFISDIYDVNCYNQAPYILSESATGKLPSGSYVTLSVDTGSKEYAKLLAQELQNAWINGSNATIVNMAIPAPNTSNVESQQGYLVSGGVVSTTGAVGLVGNTNISYPNSIQNTLNIGTSIKLPNCPNGYEGHIIVSPIDYQTISVEESLILETYISGFHLTSVTRGTSSIPPSWYDTATDKTNSVVYPVGEDIHHNQSYAVTLADMPVTTTDASDHGGSYLLNGSLIRHEISFLTICLPSGHWQTNFLPNDNWPDGQCSQSWSLYEQLLGNANYFGPFNSANPYPCALTDNQAFQQQAVGIATAY